MPIRPGTDIGRYHILEQLGEGGMAVVYKAYDTRLETDVAIKIIRTENILPAALERTLKRFQIEAKKMAQLTHPNILKVMDYGEFEGVPYLVMPFLPGGTLKNELGKPVPWQEALRLLKPVANALAFAHTKGLVHRDIKPSNILITETNEPMLTDFGIAKILVSEETLDLTITGMGVGTPEYMSPEQAEGKPVDARADVYSLGIVLYELLTGRKPFTADTPLAVLIKHSRDPLPSPSQYVHNLPGAIEKILFKALAKDPGDRYQDMNAMAAALQKAEASASQQKPETSDRQQVDFKPRTEAIISPSPAAKQPEPVKPMLPGKPVSEKPAKIAENVAKTSHEPAKGYLEEVLRDLPAGYKEIKSDRPEAKPAERPLFREQKKKVSEIPVNYHESGSGSMSAKGILVVLIAIIFFTILIVKANEENNIRASQTQDAYATSTAKIEATSTAEAIAQEIDALKKGLKIVYLDEDIRTMNLVVDTSNNFLECQYLNVSLTNFILEAHITNPQDVSEGFDYGILFRESGGNNQYRLVFNNSRYIELENWNDEIESSVFVARPDNFLTGSGESNRIELVVKDMRGILYFNGQFAGELDLSQRLNNGDIKFCSGCRSGIGKTGNVIKVDSIDLWELP